MILNSAKNRVFAGTWQVTESKGSWSRIWRIFFQNYVPFLFILSASLHTTLQRQCPKNVFLIVRKHCGCVMSNLSFFHFFPVPRNEGICYQECVGRSLLTNLFSSSSLSSQRAGGPPPGGLSYCVWVLSTSDDMQTCQPDQSCPAITLTIWPDTLCMVSIGFSVCENV